MLSEHHEYWVREARIVLSNMYDGFFEFLEAPISDWSNFERLSLLVAIVFFITVLRTTPRLKIMKAERARAGAYSMMVVSAMLVTFLGVLNLNTELGL